MSIFDQEIDRRHTNSYKWDKYPEEVLPVQLETIAKRTPGFSGADLANVMNEAAILTARYNEKSISTKRLNEALDKVTQHGIFGYSRCPDELNEVVIDRLRVRHHWFIEKDWLVLL